MSDTTSTTVQLAQSASDAAMSKVGVGMGLSGGAAAALGGLTMNTLGVIFGMVIGLLGLCIQWYYKHRLTMVEIRLREEAAARERAEHAARMGLY